MGKSNLSDVAEEVIQLLQDRIRLLKKQGDKAASVEMNQAARALAVVVKEARMLIKDAIKATENLSFDDLREIFNAWFLGLPANQKKLLLKDLKEKETA